LGGFAIPKEIVDGAVGSENGSILQGFHTEMARSARRGSASDDGEGEFHGVPSS
jgi:hypothetical protein